jgi:hypothetical protein
MATLEKLKKGPVGNLNPTVITSELQLAGLRRDVLKGYIELYGNDIGFDEYFNDPNSSIWTYFTKCIKVI